MADGAQSRTPTAPMALVLIVSATLLVNYIDRGNLATAVPLLRGEFGLTDSQLGFLLSAFYYSYVAAMVPVGWLAQRYGGRRILAAGIAIWSTATLLTGFAAGFWSLLLLRLLLGAGESAGFPCASQLFASRLRAAQIDSANGILSFSYLVGPAIGTVLGGMLMPIYGWRAVFVVFGAASLSCLAPIARIRPGPAAAPGKARAAPAGPGYLDLLRQRGLWGASLGHFVSNYNFYFILAWLPDYLVRERGLSMSRMAVVAGGAYLINAVSALAAGWAVSAWRRSGRSASPVYKSLMAFAHIASLGSMIGMALLPMKGCVACLAVFQVAMGASSPGIYAIAQIIAGPTAAGRWVGIQNACGNLAGIFAPALTGLLLEATGRLLSAFALAAALNVLGVVAWVWILPQVQPLYWSRAADSASAGEPAG